VVLAREDHQAILEVVIDAFDERFWHQSPASAAAIFTAAASPVT
jgi:hypothetical protein